MLRIDLYPSSLETVDITEAKMHVMQLGLSEILNSFHYEPTNIVMIGPFIGEIKNMLLELSEYGIIQIIAL